MEWVGWSSHIPNAICVRIRRARRIGPWARVAKHCVSISVLGRSVIGSTNSRTVEIGAGLQPPRK